MRTVVWIRPSLGRHLWCVLTTPAMSDALALASEASLARDGRCARARKVPGQAYAIRLGA
jgi:hypothetical protein